MLMVIDVSGLIHADWAVVGNDAAKSTESRIKNAVLLNKPDRYFLAFDHPQSERKRIWAGYKRDRPEKEPGLEEQMRALWVSMSKQVPCYCVPGWEADDIIATVCRIKDNEEPEKVLVYSGDSDLFQILEKGRVSVLRRFKDGSPVYMTAEGLEAKYGLRPDQWVDFLVLKGKTGQWPGAQGVGEKTAASLLKRTTLDKILENPEAIPGRIARTAQVDAIMQMAPMVPVARQVLTLRDDLEL